MKERNVICYHLRNMNTLHSYRRDDSHRQNERVGAKSKNELHAAQDNLSCRRPEPMFGRAQG